jgi:hypothetical protein
LGLSLGTDVQNHPQAIASSRLEDVHVGDVIAARDFVVFPANLESRYVDHRVSLKHGHSSLVDLRDFAFFLDYPVPLRVLRQNMLRSISHKPPHRYCE